MKRIVFFTIAIFVCRSALHAQRSNGIDTIVGNSFMKNIGLISFAGDTVLKPEYDNIYFLKDFLPGFKIIPGRFCVAVKGNNSTIYNGHKLTANVKGGVIQMFNGFITITENNKWGLLDSSGKSTIQTEYLRLKNTGFPNYIAENKDSLFGFINEQGTIIEPFIYNDVADYPKYLFFMQKQGSGLVYKMYDLGAKKFTSNVFDEMTMGADADGSHAQSLFVKRNNKFGFLWLTDSSYKILAPAYDSVRNFCKGIAAAKIGSKWGLINKAGKFILPPKYNTMSEFSVSVDVVTYASVKLNGKIGFIDLTGKEIVPPVYDELIERYDGNFLRKGNMLSKVEKTKTGFVLRPEPAKSTQSSF